MTATAQRNTKLRADPDTATRFLEQLRPKGPWVLTGIVPDGNALTVTAQIAGEVDKFITGSSGSRNQYFSVNPTKKPMTKKAKKEDIAAAEYIHADLDPRDDETPEAAKARYLAQLETFQPSPTAIIDSGNGIQALWRLSESMPPDRFAEVEARSLATTLALGGTPGTQNVDRVLRLPGTINLPNKKKLKAGRVPCEAKLIHFNGGVYPLGAFPAETPKPAAEPKAHDSGEVSADESDEADQSDIDDVIRNGRYEQFKGNRSDALWFVVNGMLRRGDLPEKVDATILNEKNRISEHVREQKDPEGYAERQVGRAIKKLTFSKSDKGPHASQGNIRIALLKLGVRVRYNAFAGKMMIEGLAGFGPVIEDAAVVRLWLLIEQRFKFRPPKDLFFLVIEDTARQNTFHPVHDYLDGLKWDGTKRIDTWLSAYGGAEDTEYTRAVGVLMLIAAVRRVRQPGCKFDEMLVLEGPQGTNKSSAIKLLAVEEARFSDDLPLTAEDKRVIEQLQGRWLLEAAELSGMSKSAIEHMKAFLSRTHDRGRMAWGRIPVDVPRQCIFVGTTNEVKYLRDTTGNRRYWPVRVVRFDLEALARDRDQLWAEASAREGAGEPIRLDPELWPAATAEQEQRKNEDPFYERLTEALGERQGKITVETLWVVLGFHEAKDRGQEASRRMTEAMARLGWQRRTIKAEGGVRSSGEQIIRTMNGFVKGDQPWTLISSGNLDM